jgi:hypothetical protein
MMSQGFAKPEPWGTWTDGPEAVLTLPVAPDARELFLLANVNAFVDPKNPHRTVRLLVDGRELETWTFSPGRIGGTRTVRIPAEALAGRTTVPLTVRIDDPASPRQLGLSQDERVLGLGFARITSWEAYTP